MIDNNPLLQPSPLQINPVDEALDYINGLAIGHFLRAAKSGVHLYAPYHNLTHKLLVVYHSLQAYAYSHPNYSTQNETQMRLLALAALFHDHNHSSGNTPDAENIERAVAYVDSLVGINSVDSTTIISAIKTTEFTNGSFPYEPMNFLSKCLRDADLCMIYTNEGRKLLMELPREIDGGPSLYRRNKQYIQEWFIKNRQFLESCEMFTEYGQLMKEFHLDRACQDFEDLVNYAVSANYVASNSNWISDATKL